MIRHKNNRPYAVGDRVRITNKNKQSVRLRQLAGQTPVGKIEKILNPDIDTVFKGRKFVVRFGDGLSDHFARNEIERF